jgi:hypothetical protein
MVASRCSTAMVVGYTRSLKGGANRRSDVESWLGGRHDVWFPCPHTPVAEIGIRVFRELKSTHQARNAHSWGQARVGPHTTGIPRWTTSLLITPAQWNMAVVRVNMWPRESCCVSTVSVILPVCPLSFIHVQILGIGIMCRTILQVGTRRLYITNSLPFTVLLENRRK